MLLRLARFARPQAPLFIAGLVTAPFSALVVISQPILLQKTIDEGIMRGDIEAIKIISLYYLGAILVGFLLESSYTLFTTYGATNTIARLRRKVYDHTLSLSQSHLDRQLTGKLLTRTTSDIEALGETLSAGSISIVLDILLVVGILGAMFNLDWVLTLLLLATTPPLAIAINVTRKRLRILYLQVRTSLSSLNAFTAERLTGLSVIQLYSDEMRVLKVYQERLWGYRNAAIKTNIYDALLYAILDGLRAMTMALLLWYGAGQFFGGTLTAGLLAAFIHYVSKLYRPIQEFSAKLATIQRASSALEKIFGLLDQKDFVDEGELNVLDVHGKVVFTDVSFAYHGGQEILSNINFTIQPGGVVALVGRTGSGKSTIGKLLTRAYGGYSGAITIDGQELCEMTKIGRAHV